MLCHSAMFTLVDDASISATDLSNLLTSLKDTVSTCRAVSVATNTVPGDSAATVLYIAEFDSWADYQEYRQDPAHLAVIDKLNGQLDRAVYVDFTEPLRRQIKAPEVR